MKPETLQKVCQLIMTADIEELDAMMRTLDYRRKLAVAQRRALALRTIKPGDRVRLRNIKPKYLEGSYGTVESMRGGKFRIVLDDNADPRALRRFGNRPVCPPSILEKVTLEAVDDEEV